MSTGGFGLASRNEPGAAAFLATPGRFAGTIERHWLATVAHKTKCAPSYALIVIEAGLLTPPMGLLIFTVKSSVTDPEVTLGDIFRGSVPFWILMLGVAVLILLRPELATWLPALMF